MFQVPKGYIAQMCEVYLQYMERVQQNGRLNTFFGLIPPYSYLLYLANFSIVQW